MAQRFDDWEGEYLAHFRTKGSKNGVRRFQTESGVWTPLGLKERREREGWGEGNRKAAKYDRKYKKYAEKMNNARNDDEAAKYGKKASLYVAKRNTADGTISKKEYREIRAEDRREERQERREEKEYKRREAQERIAAYKEERRKKNPKTMTDDELRKKIERANLEKEYRELTKSPARQLGEKLLEKYFESKAAKERRLSEKEARTYEMMRMKEQTKQAEIRRDETQARAEADKAIASANKAKAETDKLDIEKGTRMKQLKIENMRAKGTLTIGGGLKRMVNTMLTSHGDAKATVNQYRSEATGVKRAHKKTWNYNKRRQNKPGFTPLDYDPNPWGKRSGKGGKGKGKS